LGWDLGRKGRNNTFLCFPSIDFHSEPETLLPSPLLLFALSPPLLTLRSGVHQKLYYSSPIPPQGSA
jgi:hypothetical protein